MQNNEPLLHIKCQRFFELTGEGQFLQPPGNWFFLHIKKKERRSDDQFAHIRSVKICHLQNFDIPQFTEIEVAFFFQTFQVQFHVHYLIR